MRKTPDGYFDKFKELSENENWKDDTSGWTGIINNLTTELCNLGIDKLQKEKLEAQANLRYCELRNENSAIKYGLPVFTLIVSVISLFLSMILGSENSFSYHFLKIERFFEINILSSNTSNSNMIFIIMFLVVIVIAVIIVCMYCEKLRNNRQKEIIYYQTKLKIIEIVEDEKKKHNSKTTADNKRKCYMVEVEEAKEKSERTYNETDITPHICNKPYNRR